MVRQLSGGYLTNLPQEPSAFNREWVGRPVFQLIPELRQNKVEDEIWAIPDHNLQIAETERIACFDSSTTIEEAVEWIYAEGYRPTPGGLDAAIWLALRCPNIQQSGSIAFLGKRYGSPKNEVVVCLYGSEAYRRLGAQRVTQEFWAGMRFAVQKDIRCGCVPIDTGLFEG